MNKLTPEQALADIRAVRRDRADSHWLDCAIALADEVSRYKDEELDNAEVKKRLCKATVRVAEALGFSRSCVMGHKRQGEFALEAVARLVESERLQMHGYKREAESLRAENANLRAELDEIKAAPAAPEPPALSRRIGACITTFLPRLPDDVPAPPDGWVYVGMGHISNVGLGPSCNLMMWNFAGSNEWSVSTSGRDQGLHYAIRWTAPANIWHRFGLLAPIEGGGWIPHCPGDPMPCEGLCEVLLKGEMDDAKFRNNPGAVRLGTEWCWDDGHDEANIIGWRPAAEVAT
jgi:hypothetical protein